MEIYDHITELRKRYPILEGCESDIWSAFANIRDSFRKGGMLLVCGNGGSGADSEHIVGELMKEFAIKRPLSAEMKAKLKIFLWKTENCWRSIYRVAFQQ